MTKTPDIKQRAPMQFHTHPFEPFFNEDSQILILGSFPSVRSREEGFYYGHPRNRFWPMLAQCFDCSIPKSIPEKKRFLLEHDIALWDVLHSCQISGSADSSISDVIPNDLRKILDRAPVEKILCNGATAGKLCLRYCREHIDLEPIVLPSTSPANASWSLERLCAAWIQWVNIK